METAMNAKRIAALIVVALPLALVTVVAAQPPVVEGLPQRSFQRMGTVILRHGSRIMSLAYSPDGNVLAAGGGHDPVRLWNPKTGELIKEINEHNVTSLAFTDSGRTLLMAGYQKQVRLYDLQGNKETGRLEGHKAAIKSVAVSPDTQTIASGGQDGLVFLWEWNTKNKITELKGHTDEVTAVAFSPDKESNLLASAGSDRVIHLWSIETNKSKVKIDAGCCVYAIAFSADGKALFSAGDDHLIRRWDVATGKQTGTFKGHDGIILSVLVQGDTVVSGSLDKTIRFWDAKSTEHKSTIKRGQGDCDALAVARNGNLVATAGLNNTIRIFDTAKGEEILHTMGPQAGLATLALPRDNKRLVSLTTDGSVLVWDPLDGKLVKQWDSKHTGETYLALSQDGKTIATASSTLRLWNADTGAEIAQLAIKPLDPVVALAFSPDGSTLALGLRSSTVELWNVKDRKAVGNFQYQGFLHTVAWSPDGKQLAAAGAAKIFVWNVADNTLLKSFDVKEGPAPAFPMVASLAFGPDSKTLAAGCFDAIIRIYNIAAKNPTEQREMRQCEGHLAVPYAIAFSADGRSIISGSFDRTARLWEAFSGKQIANFKGHVGPVMGVAFVKDGRSVFTASTDTTVLQWDVPGLANHGKLPQVKMEPAEFETTWTALTTEETPKGHATMWKAIAAGKDMIAHTVKEKKFYLLDPERVKKLFKDLDSGNFAIRTAAMNELVGYGRWMEGRYDAAMANPPSLEYKRRIEILKEKLNEKQSASLAQERLRLRRFMLICEQVGGAEAIEALQMLADRGPEDEIRDEAKGSLERLKK
jgi:WD40 repeat protein